MFPCFISLDQNLRCIFILWLLMAAGCAAFDPIEKYLEANPDLPTEKILALRSRYVVNGMTEQEVKLILGEPMFVEQREDGIIRWIYRNRATGMEPGEAYSSGSAFPAGLGFLIPLHYRSREIQIDFYEQTTCRIEEILNF